ncbi:MAG TPA: signal peptidase II [Nocardioidaceae bacterium]|nr:signal peptidase II [Nocardioidaceae bacterium]
MQAARGASLSSSDQTSPDSQTPSRRRYLGLFAAIAAVGYTVDVVSKVVAVEALAGEPPVEIVGHYFTLYLARNPGAAFSTGTSYTIVLTFIAIAAAIVVTWIARRLGSLGWAIGLGFLLAGVLGNLTDRIFRSPGPLRGHVIDFFMFPSFPVFNVADICINIAAGVIIIQALRGIRVDGLRHEDHDRKRDDRKRTGREDDGSGEAANS